MWVEFVVYMEFHLGNLEPWAVLVLEVFGAR
jgi:hypothetical protein